MKKQFLLALLFMATVPFFVMCGDSDNNPEDENKDKDKDKDPSTTLSFDFENWKHYKPSPTDLTQYTPYDDVNNTMYTTLNFLSTLPPELFPCPQTVYRDAGRNGGYAAKLVSNSGNVGLGGEDVTKIFLPGVVGTLDVVIAEITAKFGRPHTQPVSSLTCWYKYSPVKGDSASIEVILSRTVDGKNEDIGWEKQIIKGDVTEWKQLKLENIYYPDNNIRTHDKITILFVSSAGYNFENLFGCKGQEGSTLWIDDVVLE